MADTRAKLQEQKRAKEQLEARRLELEKAQRAGDWVRAWPLVDALGSGGQCMRSRPE